MKTVFVMTAGLFVFGQAMALAQDSQRNMPPKHLRSQPTTQTGGGSVPEAPIGHRQPRPSDLPPETGKNNPANLDAQDRELDRMIKNICKGC